MKTTKLWILGLFLYSVQANAGYEAKLISTNDLKSIYASMKRVSALISNQKINVDTKKKVASDLVRKLSKDLSDAKTMTEDSYTAWAVDFSVQEQELQESKNLIERKDFGKLKKLLAIKSSEVAEELKSRE